ncbi:MAG: hypothetical protein N2C14_07430, partial [Planctomycetales bacterium]
MNVAVRFIAVAILLGSALDLAAEDVIRLAPLANNRGAAVLRAEIIDYTGREIRARLPSGKELTYPSERVLDFQTEYSPRHLAADKLFDARRYAAALGEYQLAAREEERTWVRRMLLARRIWCHQYLKQ